MPTAITLRELGIVNVIDCVPPPDGFQIVALFRSFTLDAGKAEFSEVAEIELASGATSRKYKVQLPISV
jgi:hypothetical protein